MEKIISLIFLLAFFACCLGGSEPETKYVCSDGTVVTNKSKCPMEYVCADGRRVNNPDDCGPNTPATTISAVKYICPDGSVVDDFEECGITSSTSGESVSTVTSSTTTTLSDKTIHFTELNLADEYVEIINEDTTSVDMGRWILRDEDGNIYEFPTGFKLFPERTVRVYTDEGSDSPAELYWNRKDNVWDNNGDTASLWNRELNLVDMLTVSRETTTTAVSTTTSVSTIITTSVSVTSSTAVSTTIVTTTSTTFPTTSTVPPEPVPAGSVIITEVMYNLPGTDEGREWVEIFADDVSIDLSGWRLQEERIDLQKTQHTLNPYQGDLFLEKNEYAVIVDNPELFLEDYPGFDGTIIDSSFSLLNNALTLRLLDGRDGNEIDFIFYISDLGADGNGRTLVRSTDYPEHDLEEGSTDMGTPGY